VRLAGLVLVFATFCARAAEPAWLLVAPQRVVAGEPFEVIVVAPVEETLPDELTLRAKIDVTELEIAAHAVGEPQGARRRYGATMPTRAGGPATLALAERDSNVVAVVVARRDAMQRLTGRDEAAAEPPLSEEEPVYFVLGVHEGTNARFQLSFKYRLFDPTTGIPVAIASNNVRGIPSTKEGKTKMSCPA